MDVPAAAPMTTPPAEEGGFTVEIKVAPDGAMTVNGTPAKGVGEALKLALQLIQAGGSSGDEEFANGFASAGASEETVEMTPDTSMGAR